MTIDASEAARALGALSQKPHSVTCAVCGQVTEKVHIGARYCSNTCRQRAKHARNRAAKAQGLEPEK